MKWRRRVMIVAFLGGLICILRMVSPFTGVTTPQAQAAADVGHYANPNALLIENRGQFDSQVRFVLQSAEGQFWLTDNAIWITQYPQAMDADLRQPASKPELNAHGVHLRISFENATGNAAPQPFGLSATKVSYLKGKARSGWHSNVPVWHGVRYRALYPGVDLVITPADGESPLRWQFEVDGDVDLSAVQIKVEGARDARVAGDRLHLATAAGDVVLPLIEVPATQTEMRPQIVVLARDTVTVAAPMTNQAVDRATSAVQPEYSTLLGGSSWEIAQDVALQADGSATVVGRTPSADFPVSVGAFDDTLGFLDAFVARLTAAGDGIVFATYLGGSDTEWAQALAVHNGKTYLTGETASADFPLTGELNGDSDAYFALLDEDGSDLLAATLIGSTGDDRGYDIVLDDSAAYIVGRSWNPDQAQTDYDVLAAKLSHSGVLAYTRFIGGALDDVGYGIDVLGGKPHLTGYTASSDFATSGYSGADDVFVVRLNTSGTPELTVLLGDGQSERGNAIALNAAGDIFLGGYTQSAAFPVTSGSHAGSADAFIVRLNSSGTLKASLLVGGAGWDEALDIQLQSHSTAVLAGYSDSGDFPTTINGFDQTANGGDDAFVLRAQLPEQSPTAITYSSLVGGSADDQAQAVAVDDDGYAVVTGYTRSSDFPLTENAVDKTFEGTREAFVTRLWLLTEAVSNLAAGNDSPTIIGQATQLSASASGSGEIIYSWSFGDGSLGSGQQIDHVYPAVGVYTAMVTATNDINSITATTTVTITQIPTSVTYRSVSATSTIGLVKIILFVGLATAGYGLRRLHNKR